MNGGLVWQRIDHFFPLKDCDYTIDIQSDDDECVFKEVHAYDIIWHNFSLSLQTVDKQKRTMLKDEKGHYTDGNPLRWKPEDYGSIDIVLKRDKHIYPFELYSFGTAAILFLAPRIREFVAGRRGIYGYDRKMSRIQYAFDTLEQKILLHNEVSLKTIFEKRLSLEEATKVQTGLNSFARNLKYMEY